MSCCWCWWCCCVAVTCVRLVSQLINTSLTDRRTAVNVTCDVTRTFAGKRQSTSLVSLCDDKGHWTPAVPDCVGPYSALVCISPQIHFSIDLRQKVKTNVISTAIIWIGLLYVDRLIYDDLEALCSLLSSSWDIRHWHLFNKIWWMLCLTAVGCRRYDHGTIFYGVTNKQFVKINLSQSASLRTQLLRYNVSMPVQ